MNLDELNKTELQILANAFNIPVSQNKPELKAALLKVNSNELESKYRLLIKNDETLKPIKLSTLNSDQDHDSRMNGNTQRFNLIGIISVIVSCGILYFAFKTYTTAPIIIDCENIEPYKFNDKTSYNIKLFDLLDYTTCNSYSDCETEIKRRLTKLNQISDIKILVEIEECKSSQFGIFDLESARKHAILSNSDLVIFGAIESKSVDSLLVNLSYASPSKDSLILFSKTESELTFGINSIFELSQTNKDFEEIENLILWNLADNELRKDTNEGVRKCLFFLDQITAINPFDFSNAECLKGIIYRYEGDNKKAKVAFSSAIDRFPLNHIPYYERAVINLVQDNYVQAIKDIQRYWLLKSYHQGFLDSMNTPRLDYHRKNLDYQLSTIIEFEKENKLSLGCNNIIDLAKSYKETFPKIPALLRKCREMNYSKEIEEFYGMSIDELIIQAKKEIAAANN